MYNFLEQFLLINITLDQVFTSLAVKTDGERPEGNQRQTGIGHHKGLGRA